MVLSTSLNPVRVAFKSAVTAPPVWALIAAITSPTVGSAGSPSSTISCGVPVRSVMTKSTSLAVAPSAKPISPVVTVFGLVMVNAVPGLTAVSTRCLPSEAALTTSRSTPAVTSALFTSATRSPIVLLYVTDLRMVTCLTTASPAIVRSKVASSLS